MKSPGGMSVGARATAGSSAMESCTAATPDHASATTPTSARGGKYYPHSDWEVGGWEHGPLCMVLYRRRPDLDDLAGAAWEDTADGSIMRRDPMLDPNTMEIKIRRPKCSG